MIQKRSISNVSVAKGSPYCLVAIVVSMLLFWIPNTKHYLNTLNLRANSLISKHESKA